MMFQAREALRISGLSYRQLDHVFRQKLLRLTGGGGSGVPRRFGVYDLVALALLRDALQAGIPARAVAPALRLIQQGHVLPALDRLAGTRVWCDGHAAKVVRAGAVAGKQSRSIAFLLDLGAVAERVNARLQEMAA